MTIFTDLSPDVIRWFFANNTDRFDNLHMMNIGDITQYADIPLLPGIYPPFEYISREALINYSELQFDYEYSNYLNNVGFLPFMYVVCMEYYHGNDLNVYFTNRSDYRDSVIECFQKILFGRYGINSALVSDVEDLSVINFDPSLSVNGLMCIGADIDRAISLDPKMIERIMN